MYPSTLTVCGLSSSTCSRFSSCCGDVEAGVHQVVFIELLLPPRINRPETRTENTISLASLPASKRCVNVSHAVSHIFLLYPVFEVETSMAESFFAVHLLCSQITHISRRHRTQQMNHVSRASYRIIRACLYKTGAYWRNARGHIVPAWQPLYQ